MRRDDQVFEREEGKNATGRKRIRVKKQNATKISQRMHTPNDTGNRNALIVTAKSTRVAICVRKVCQENVRLVFPKMTQTESKTHES